MRQTIAGLNSKVLGDYLAQVGLAYVMSTQADPETTFGWSGARFWVDAEADVESFLLEGYRPTPVLSPWNGGSGFGPKDKAQAAVLARIARCVTPRLTSFQRALAVSSQVIGEAREYDWAKDRIAQELRNRLDDDALAWIDAAIVLRGSDKPSFPPLLGTGGNDGRLEFSAKFHERLIDVIPELGAKRSKSQGWLRDALWGTVSTQLANGPVGMFDGGRAGGAGSSMFDAGSSRVNPWVFVLMTEGLTRFASGVSRRLGRSSGRAAMPFTFSPGVGGNSAAVAEGNSRGEFWAPLVAEATWSSFQRLLTDSRANWDGERARTAAEMYAATRSLGVTRGIHSFHRFSFNQAFGLAYVAVRTDTVSVASTPGIALAKQPMRRLDDLRRAEGAACDERHTRFLASATGFVRDPHPRSLLCMLADLTRAEAVAQRTAENSAVVSKVHELASAADAVSFLVPLLRSRAEVRLAASLASSRWSTDLAGTVSLRRLLVGEPGKPPVVGGLGVRPLHHVMADLVVWACVHPDGDTRDTVGVVPIVGRALAAPAADAHRWAMALNSGDPTFDHRLLEEAVLACVALDWSMPLDRPEWPVVDGSAYLPEVTHTAALLHKVAVTAQSTSSAPQWRGTHPGWPSALRAGHVQTTSSDMVALLNRSYLLPLPAGRRHRQADAAKTAISLPDATPLSRDGKAVLAAAAATKPSRSRLVTFDTESTSTTDMQGESR